MNDLGETILRYATMDDVKYIDSLRKKEGDALGFMPIQSYYDAIGLNENLKRHRYRYAELLVTIDNNDYTGFCYVSYAGKECKIFQIVIQEDARRLYRAMLIINHVERQCRIREVGVITCRVAMDLESNFFWRAIGFIPVKEVISTWLNQKESKSKRPLWIYRKEVEISQQKLNLKEK